MAEPDNVIRFAVTLPPNAITLWKPR